MAQIALQTGEASKTNVFPPTQELLALYLRAAGQGYAEAQTTLGHLYAEGLGVARDPAEARKWYAQAADQNEPGALHWIGGNYLNGENAPQTLAEATQSSTKALEAYTKAAAAGYPLSQFNLGMMHLAGQGVAANAEEAFGWIQRAADQNLPAAQTQLASMYETGHGTTQDFAQAYQWYVKGAAGGDQEAARSVDRMARHLGQ